MDEKNREIESEKKKQHQINLQDVDIREMLYARNLENQR